MSQPAPRLQEERIKIAGKTHILSVLTRIIYVEIKAASGAPPGGSEGPPGALGGGAPQDGRLLHAQISSVLMFAPY